jgi:hypothetical protein
MITIIYTVPIASKAEELAWLREQKIFPSCQDCYDWDKMEAKVRFGMIVNSEAALTVKLRHKLDIQENYRQR